MNKETKNQEKKSKSQAKKSQATILFVALLFGIIFYQKCQCVKTMSEPNFRSFRMRQTITRLILISSGISSKRFYPDALLSQRTSY